MTTVYTVLLFMGLILLAIPLESVAGRIKLPFPVFLVLMGYVTGEILIYTGIDTGIRWYNFDVLIFHVFLPVLI
ncbi:MAG: hypothetical protein EP297_11505, partial [Gammaproteobacteria bacterium]